jgi:hypothetical protein
MARAAKRRSPSADEQLDALHREAIMLLTLRMWLLQKRPRPVGGKTDRNADPHTSA